MDIENPAKERVSAFTGQKSQFDHALLQNSDCEAVRNFVMKKGRLRKVWGRSLYAELAVDPGYRVSFLERFRDRWVAQQGNGIAWESASASKNMVQVGAIRLGRENRIFGERWLNRIYLSNGVENKFIEDTGATSYPGGLLNLGLLPPGKGAKFVAVQPDPVISTVGNINSLLPNGTYGYAITWWDNNRKVESLPLGATVGEDGLWRSAAYFFAYGNRVTFNSNPNNSLRINVQALKDFGYDADRVTHFIVYRWTQADNTSFKRCSDVLQGDGGNHDLIPIARDYYDDVSAEDDLGQILDESLSPPPSGLFYVGYGDANQDQAPIGPKFTKFWRDQLWKFGVNYPGTENGYDVLPNGVSAVQTSYAAQTGIVYASKVGFFDYWIYDYDIGRATDQRDTGMAIWKNTLMLFKERSAYYVDGTNPDNYEIRDLDKVRGIIAAGSLQETSVGPMGLAEDGFVLFGTGGADSISEEIEDVIDTINFAQADLITSSFDLKEEKYYCHVPTTEEAKNTLVCVYDIKTKSWCFTSLAAGAERYSADTKGRGVGLSGDRNNGRLYDATDRSLVTMNGQTLFGSWASKHFDWGSPERSKQLHQITIVARAIRDFRLSVDVIPDFGEQDGFSIEDVNPDVRRDVLAADAGDEEGMKWDDGQWAAAATRRKFTILAQCVAKNVQIIIRNSDKDADRASFEIEEIILEASLIGDGGSNDSESAAS